MKQTSGALSGVDKKAEFNPRHPKRTVTCSQATLKSRAGKRGSFPLLPTHPFLMPTLCYEIGYDVTVEEEAVEAISRLQRGTHKSLASSGDGIGRGKLSLCSFLRLCFPSR